MAKLDPAKLVLDALASLGPERQTERVHSIDGIEFACYTREPWYGGRGRRLLMLGAPYAPRAFGVTQHAEAVRWFLRDWLPDQLSYRERRAAYEAQQAERAARRRLDETQAQQRATFAQALQATTALPTIESSVLCNGEFPKVRVAFTCTPGQAVALARFLATGELREADRVLLGATDAVGLMVASDALEEEGAEDQAQALRHAAEVMPS